MQGTVYDNMRKSKRKYLYAVGRCNRQEPTIRYTKMAECISNNNTRYFYREVKKFKSAASMVKMTHKLYLKSLLRNTRISTTTARPDNQGCE